MAELTFHICVDDDVIAIVIDEWVGAFYVSASPITVGRYMEKVMPWPDDDADKTGRKHFMYASNEDVFDIIEAILIDASFCDYHFIGDMEEIGWQVGAEGLPWENDRNTILFVRERGVSENA